MRFEVVRDVQTVRLSDIRLTLRRETYPSLTTSIIVPGDFSTPLEMTEPFIVPPLAGERWYEVPKGETTLTVRLSDFQTSDGPFGPAVGSLYNHIWPPLLIKPYNRAFGTKGNRKQLPSAALPLWCLTAPPSPR